MYDFDERIERRNTGCAKYDAMMQAKGRDDLLSFWVADMDFRAPEEVLQAMRDRVDHGVFGYGILEEDYLNAVCGWFEKNHNWRPEKEWIIPASGVVFALYQAVSAFSGEGDPVLIMQPVYYPFAEAIERTGRRVVNSELLYTDGRYEMDFADIEEKIVNEKIKLCIFCSPQNPTGRVWTPEELRTFSGICIRHQVLVISDEIHCDFVYPGHTHTVYASLSEEARESCIICTAPSKTFNLAGLQASNLIIPNARIRKTMKSQLMKIGYYGINTMGVTACRAAYEKGGPWLEALRQYLLGNLECLREGLADIEKEVRIVEPDGLYLVWLDCSGMGMSREELERFITDEAGLWLDEGSLFGKKSGTFMRINIACPRSLLEEGIGRLTAAVKKRRHRP